MRAENLSDAINGIQEDILRETARVRSRKHRLLPCIAAAACFALIVCAAARGIPRKLPIIPLVESNAPGKGGGWVSAYDISEIVNDNPWTPENTPATLPVYRNTLSYNGEFVCGGADRDKMQKQLRRVAGRLGLDSAVVTVTDEDGSRSKKLQIGGSPVVWYSQFQYLQTQPTGYDIRTEATLTTTIFFEPAVSLPEGYRFYFHDSYEEHVQAAEYLKETYAGLLSMKQPSVNISGSGYDSNREPMYHISFFDGSGSIREQILHYNFDRVDFYGGDDGTFYMVQVFETDRSQKLGEYPLITAEEALALLGRGWYDTSGPYDMPGAEYAAKVELIYRNIGYEAFYLPYYRFYVELPERKEADGLKTYGIYDVPAVRQEYLSDMPTDGVRFNGIPRRRQTRSGTGAADTRQSVDDWFIEETHASSKKTPARRANRPIG